MANKNVPVEEQSFLFCDGGIDVKELFTFLWKGDGMKLGMVVLPLNTSRLSVRIGTNNDWQTEIDLPDLEAGQFYWILGPPWVEVGYREFAVLILPLNEEGIEIFTKNMWNDEKNKNLQLPFSTRDEWSSYEEYRDFVIQLWEVRKEVAREQLSGKK